MQSARARTPAARTRRPGAATGLLLVVAYLGFISLGLPDGVLGVAWPSMLASFRLELRDLGALLAAAMAGYLISSFCSGAIVARLGVGPLLALSAMVCAMSLAGYALAPLWLMVVVCGTMSGLGAGAIDAGINAYAAATFAPRIITWLHASYGVGATVGPLIMTGVLDGGGSWRVGYGLIGAMLAAMAACFLLTARLWAASPLAPTTHSSMAPSSAPSLRLALGQRSVQINCVLFFIYTGLEVTAGQWSFSLLSMERGIDMQLAGGIVSAYWCALTAGRIAVGFLAGRHLSIRTTLLGSAVMACVAAGMLWMPAAAGSGVDATARAAASAIGLALLGLAFAPIYPMLIAETPRRVGERFATASIGFQVASAYLGAAAVPGLAGVLAQSRGLESIGAVLLMGTTILLALLLLHMRRG